MIFLNNGRSYNTFGDPTVPVLTHKEQTMTNQNEIQEPEEQARYTTLRGESAGQQSTPPESLPTSAGLPASETAVATTDDVIILDPTDYERDPINRADVVQFADTLMGIHPNALEIGKLGMRTVAQLAIATGANPLPGTNGIHAWLDKNDNVCIQFGIGYWRDKADRAGGILWLSRPRPYDAHYVRRRTRRFRRPRQSAGLHLHGRHEARRLRPYP